MIVPILMRRFAQRLAFHPPATLRVALLLAAILAYGASGFVFFELEAKPELTFFDGLWWAIVTVTTVGYGDYFPTTLGGRFLVAAPLMFFGIGLLGYVVSLATSALVESRNRELKGMANITYQNHVVIFNFPSLDKTLRVIDELRHDEEFGHMHEIVLVDEDLAELPEELVERHVHFVKGPPARDATLGRANIDRATHAIVLAKRPGDPNSDALNLSITLAIEARTRAVRTTVECVEIGGLELLKKAGCDSIVCLARFDAHFIGNEVLQPGIQSVVDGLLGTTTSQQLCLSAVPAKARTFKDVIDACAAARHVPLGILRGHESLLNLGADVEVVSGDRVISIGSERLA